jgi:hypothetical protein
LKVHVALIALIVAGFAASACTMTTRPTLLQPADSVDTMRRAYREDDPSLFLHTLGRPVLREYSEHLLRVGWSDIRPHVGGFVDQANVVESAEYRETARESADPRGFVRPDQGAPLMRLRLRIDNDEEDFLFQREVDDAPEGATQAKGFWIGDRYYIRSEHPSPGTYLETDSPEAERTHWRIVFPYYPFQREGPLTYRLQQELANR